MSAPRRTPLPAANARPTATRRRVLSSALGVGALAATGGLGACGDGGTTAGLAADAAVDLQGATIKLMVNQPHVLAFTDLLGPRFEAEFGGKLEVTAIPYDQLTSKQILDVQGGDGEFDVFDYFYFGLGELVNADALIDLTDWIGANPDIATDDFLPSIYDPYTLLDGKRYGLPFDGDTHVLYYNAEVFDRYGVQPPTTWDEYDAAAAKITQDSGGSVYGAIVEGQQVPMILGCSFINRLAGYGGTLVDADGRPAFAGAEGLAALQHLVDVSPHALPTPLQTGFDQANSAFLSGQGAMLDTWTDLGLKAQDPSSSKIVDKWGVVTLPVGGSNTTPRSALDAGFGLGVSSASAQQDKAAAFVKWATDKDRNFLLASTAGSGIDPARTSVLASAEYAAAAGKATDVIREGLEGDPLAWPSQAGAPKALQDLVDQLALAIQGSEDPQAALDKAAESWEAELG
ncbi:ABC transporter substrate-binding protein [Kineococcus radiotolerans]|uniref:Extracellular solute-binding protein family 1 n=1 Tax=Kineococcus radiotolerans (strain ATCC BAA-149 / DSM 14245 / SRS30216) TaxID=266940 RepID=A6WDN3_KINRD|nr:sugar ABC transporter substrate-binding protein [Kineococcus radiotolerans]ABS04922.1 extracellular solute-binding protein family 1 [Kineococcus radiotolerans SRS30216 = ATCC BAA-149]